MASEPPAGGGDGGGDGIGSKFREKHRWPVHKVYTRRFPKKNSKPSKAESSSQVSNPLPQSPLHIAVTNADGINSSIQQPPPPPSAAAAVDILVSAPSNEDASSLNQCQPETLPHHRRRESLASSSHHEQLRELRRKLNDELVQVRTLTRRLEAQELQLGLAAPAAALPVTPKSNPLSHFSANNPFNVIRIKRAPSFPNSVPAPILQRLIVPMPAVENGMSDATEKEKRTPKANQLYQSSEFLLGNEKFPPSESHSRKKHKPNGVKKGVTDHSTQSVTMKVYARAFKRCSSLLSKLMKHEHAWVFNTPVDVKGLGLVDYFRIIKEPMDFGTVKSRLGKNWYKSPGEFAEDVRLTFRNAMTYNPKGQDVHIMAQQLLQIFEEQWPSIEAGYKYHSYALPPLPPPLDVRPLELSGSAMNPIADSKTKSFNYMPHLSRPPALQKPKAKDPNKRDMTSDEKQKLGDSLQSLPAEKVDQILQIIKKNRSCFSENNDEIEVDIDSIDAESLWELYRLVTNYKKNLSKQKRKAERAVLAMTVAEQNVERRMPGSIPETAVTDAPNENNTVTKKDLAFSSPAVGGKMRDDLDGSNSSSSCSSDSSSSDSDSDSDSSSAYGSKPGHSPRT